MLALKVSSMGPILVVGITFAFKASDTGSIPVWCKDFLFIHRVILSPRATARRRVLLNPRAPISFYGPLPIKNHDTHILPRD